MKRIILLLTVFVLASTAQAQNAYYDALYLARLNKADLERIEFYSSTTIGTENGDISLDEFYALWNAGGVKIMDLSGVTDLTSLYDLNPIGADRELHFILKSNTSKELELNGAALINLSDGVQFNINPTPLNLTEAEKKQVKNFSKIIDNPFVKSNQDIDISYLKTAIEKYNGFISTSDINGYAGKGFIGGAAVSSILTSIPQVFSKEGIANSSNQSNIMDGLTKYYADQFKKAQLLTYMNLFKKTIGETGELEVLLPRTYDKLQKADPSNFPDLGDEYKDIFNEDLKNILDNLISHVDSHGSATSVSPYVFQVLNENDEILYYIQNTEGMKKFDKRLKFLNGLRTTQIREKDIYQCLKILKDVAYKLSNNYQIEELINYLDLTYYSADILKKRSPKVHENMAYVFHGVNLFQNNLRDTTRSEGDDGSNTWLSFNQLQQLNTIKEIELFAGLIYQQDEDYFERVLFPGGNAPTLKQRKEFTDKVGKILSLLIELQEFRKTITQENKGGTFSQYMQLVVDLLQKSEFLKDELNEGLELAGHVMKLYDNVVSKDYGNSLYHALNIFEMLLNDGEQMKFLEVIQSIEKYTSFMADIVKAENSDEVKGLITKHAAPPATFMLKRERRSTLSIGGHPGYFASTENLDNGGSGFVSGFTLPMGLEYSLKIKHGVDNASSISLMFQIVDLGAILNFRVDDSTSDLPEQVTFSQIFSPGVSLNYGVKNSPLTIGLGYQRTPELRKINADGVDVFAKGDRFFIRMGWDIPLFNIAKSNKR